MFWKLLDISVQQDNAPVHKAKIIGNFFKKTRGRYRNGQHTVQIWILLINYGRFWIWAITKTGNLEENVYEIWNEIDADVVRNLYENYTNRLLDVKNS